MTGDSLIHPGPAAARTLWETLREQRQKPGETRARQVVHRTSGSWRIDSTPDDGGLVMQLEGRGLVILTGCGHPGVLNTVREAVRQTGVHKVSALVGGFHLCGLSTRRIRATIRDLREFSPRWMIPSHWSGLEAFPRGSRST